MKKILALVLAMMLLIAVPVLAENEEVTTEETETTETSTVEEGELEDGTETITTDTGISLSFDKYDFKVDIDENGDIGGEYLGETPDPIGFNIVTAEDTDAETYMTEAAEAHEAELMSGNFYSDSKEWYYFSYTSEASEGNVAEVVVAARNYDGGCYIVTAYGFYAEDEANENEEYIDANADLADVLDSLSFPE